MLPDGGAKVTDANVPSADTDVAVDGAIICVIPRSRTLPETADTSSNIVNMNFDIEYWLMVGKRESKFAQKKPRFFTVLGAHG